MTSNQKRNFSEFIEQSAVVLTEGSVVERISRNPLVELDPFVAHSGLIYSDRGKSVLEAIYREYLDIGRKYKLPMLSMAPTWRANPERIAKSMVSKRRRINQECVAFLHKIISSYGDYSDQVYLGGLMACRRNAYDPAEALTKEEAIAFHREQVEALVESGVNYIKAATLPAFSEAFGIAKVLSKFDLPYVLSFVIKSNGCLLDGTPLDHVINVIDKDTRTAPAFYMVNCVHPTFFESGVSLLGEAKSRILGIQANTSSKNPDELDNLEYLDTEDPGTFADQLLSVHRQFGVKVLGGCCGTDARHIEELARRLDTFDSSTQQ